MFLRTNLENKPNVRQQTDLEALSKKYTPRRLTTTPYKVSLWCTSEHKKTSNNPNKFTHVLTDYTTVCASNGYVDTDSHRAYPGSYSHTHAHLGTLYLPYTGSYSHTHTHLGTIYLRAESNLFFPLLHPDNNHPHTLDKSGCATCTCGWVCIYRLIDVDR